VISLEVGCGIADRYSELLRPIWKVSLAANVGAILSKAVLLVMKSKRVARVR
jgi:hypothetical protein